MCGFEKRITADLFTKIVYVSSLSWFISFTHYHFNLLFLCNSREIRGRLNLAIKYDSSRNRGLSIDDDNGMTGYILDWRQITRLAREN